MKTKANIVELDTELDLFDINEWDFNKPFDNHAEFLSNIDDMDLFNTGFSSFISRIPMFLYSILAIGLLGTVIMIAIQMWRPSKEYLELSALEGPMKQKKTVEYVEGSETSDEDIIAVSKISSVYFQILNSEKGYSLLDDLCLEGSSFYKEYNTNLNKIRYSYDMHDCYVRLLCYYGTYCKLNKVERLVEKDGIYYCYLDLTAPSKEDIQSYIKLYAYNFTKHFTVTDFTESNIVRYMYSMEGASRIPCSRQIVCITMRKNAEGNLMILEDDAITRLCIDAYEETLNEVSKLMGVTIEK